MWNDTDEPIAYLITFRTYGTWLHGDRRGSVDRHNNRFGTPKIQENKAWKNHNTRQLTGEPVRLSAKQRRAVRIAIRETCKKRGWVLYAINVRTNHVHVVVASHGRKSSIFLNAFKANATRSMRETGLWPYDHSPWVDKGSKRKLWNDRDLNHACSYVEYEQGEDLPEEY
jgi:REP element-mobilizing transposase RayT